MVTLLAAITRTLGAPPVINPAPPVSLPTTFNPISTIGTVYDNAFKILTLIAGIVAVLYVVYAGIQFIMSAGNADKQKAARTSLINAVIGIMVVSGAYFIINFAISLGSGLQGLVGKTSSTTENNGSTTGNTIPNNSTGSNINVSPGNVGESCSAFTTCGIGLQCASDGTCERPTTGDSCNTLVGCQGGSTCVNDICASDNSSSNTGDNLGAKSCFTNSDCTAGAPTCILGQCQ